MNSLFIFKISQWVNFVALGVFILMQAYWFVKEKKGPKEIPPFFLGFILYNLPFLLLALSMYFQSPPELLLGSIRLFTLLILTAINVWLHYNGDKGGNSIGMLVIFFLMIAVPAVVIIEIFVWVL
ncbi:MAG: hypothetical protein HOP08_20450 [Cyclobacteriaceae bacterium]|nr:hypothetical protein [Cyclobacteriaceae bacterium]